MFLAPLFLMGLIAIGVPIWLHRVARANPVQHPFPSLMLLEASEMQRTAKRTLRYWLLLAVRILLLAALAFAFAGPLWQRKNAAAIDDDTRLHAIVLDASLSMQQAETWPRAMAAVGTVIESLRPSDQIMLVRAAGRRMDIVQEPISARDAGTLRASLSSVQPGIERLDFGFAMSSAEQWLRTPHPPAILHLISDFQQSGAPLRFADLEPPARSQVLMHDVGDLNHGNAYIEQAALSEGDNRALEVRIRSTHREPQQRTVVLQVDGKELARRSITLAASSATPSSERNVAGEGGGSALARAEGERAADALATDNGALTSVLFEEVTFAPGAHRIEAMLEPHDALSQDDRFFAVLEHSDPKALLLARSIDADDAAYFAAAIGALTAPRVAVSRELAGTFVRGEFDDQAVLVVPDIFSLSSTAAARVEDYVSAGGALLTTLGTDARVTQHPLFSSWQIDAPRNAPVTIGEIDASHPILRDTPAWHRVRFFRQRHVEVGENDRVLIAHSDGSPLLIERSLGAGRMLVLTAPIDRAWNDLAIHPIFVQFISQATRYLIGRNNAASSVTVGAPVTTGLTRVAGGQIFDPSGKRALDLASTTNADRLVPNEVGFYEIRHAHGERWLAVNTDRRESSLRRLTSDYVARWQALRQRTPPTASATTEVKAKTETHSLGPALIWIAAMLLLIELLLANRYLTVRREVAR
jgi:hypothetical protein